MISVTALAGVPALVRRAFGETVLRHANRAAMLDIELIEDRDCFIPHATMTSFLSEIERRAGDRDFVLLLAPHLTLRGYGCWGEYVLGAETLGLAIERAIDSIGYHSRGDRVVLSVAEGIARLSYLSAARGRAGYPHVALGAAGVIFNLCRSCAPAGWRPFEVDLDLPRPRSAERFEEAFGCRVRFEAPVTSVQFSASLLSAPQRARGKRLLLTIEDVARARLAPASREDMLGVVEAHVWTQVLAGSVSLDRAACALEVSTRTLQRLLGCSGTDFRSLANELRVRRATELLRGTRATVTEIGAELGYSSPANFARAFRKATGIAPELFRRN